MQERASKNLLQQFLKKKVFCFFFYAVFISNKSSFSSLEWRIHSRSTDSSLNSLSAVICKWYVIVVQRCGEIAYKCTLDLKREKTWKFFLRFPQKLYTFWAKSSVINGAVKSSEIKILRLKDSMFSTNAMNFSNDNDFTGW